MLPRLTEAALAHSRPVRRRTLLAGTAAGSAAALASGCAPSDQGTPGPAGGEPVTLMTSFGAFGRDAYTWVAVAKGFFAEAGFDVTVEPGDGTEANVQILAGQTAEFAVFDLTGAIIARAQGATGFTTLAAVQQLPLAAVMCRNPELDHPMDLHGHTVGLPAGAATDLLFTLWAEAAGVDLSQVRQEAMSPPELVPALTAGRVDAIGQFVVGRPLVQGALDGEVTMFPYGDYLSDLYGIGLHTTTTRAEHDPEGCIRFRDALLRGLEYAVEHPDEAGQILHEAVPESDPETAAEELRLMHPYVTANAQPAGALSLSKLARAVALLQAANVIDRWVEPEDIVDEALILDAES